MREPRTRRVGSALLVCAVLLIALAACGEGRSARPEMAPAPPEPSLERRDSQQRFIGAAEAPLVSVRDIVSSRAFVGRRVRVPGRCLSATSEHPLGRLHSAIDEWQLEADGVAIYVTGPPPMACAAGIEDSVTTCALVSEDTLPAIGDLPPSPRRYLAPFPSPPFSC